jgi:sugar lactone lactonase YvrE
MPVRTPAPPHHPPGDVDAGVIDDARRRQRRLRGAVAVTSTVLAAIGLIVYLANGSKAHRTPAADDGAGAATVVGGPLKAPYGLAIAPGGDLYIVDTGRDQVLRRLPSGRLEVVAGNGRRGFSGDGGRAADASLRLGNPSGIAVARNGTLYIADSGNDRVRAVLADGTIETVAGDGRRGAGLGLILHDTVARDASLGEVGGLAIGPDGDLYIAAANVVRLTPQHAIDWVAGGSEPIPCGNVYCNPAGEADFDQPDQLAFDRAGDLLVSGSSYGLFEIAADGRLEYLGQARGDGAPEALAAAPDGTVVEAGRDGLERLPANGMNPPPNAAQGTVLAPGESIAGDLDRALGRSRRLGRGNVFIGGDGVAVGPNGVIYADTNVGNTFTSVSALVEVAPSGVVRALWKS